MTKSSSTNTESKATLNSDKACVISLTKQGNELVKKLASKVKTKKSDLVCYTIQKYKSDQFKTFIKLEEFFEKAFKEFDTIIAIMATGIVVREIAPFLKSKTKDPGVIVLDVNGSNTISLLSGHMGNANENTRIIANAINSNPVITTASDCLNLVSVDTIAKELDLKLVDFSKAKKVTALIVEGKPVVVYSDYELPNVYKNMEIKKMSSLSGSSEGSIIISELNNFDLEDNLSVQLFPKTITIGIGTKKDIDGRLVVEKVKKLLDLNNISEHSIRCFATIENKKDEQGILFAKDFFNVDLEIIDKANILEVEDQFKTSEFVKETVGVGSVSEACGYLSSGKGKKIGKILKEDGMVLSLWAKNRKNAD